jgi:hypothetical protein
LVEPAGIIAQPPVEGRDLQLFKQDDVFIPNENAGIMRNNLGKEFTKL